MVTKPFLFDPRTCTRIQALVGLESGVERAYVFSEVSNVFFLVFQVGERLVITTSSLYLRYGKILWIFGLPAKTSCFPMRTSLIKS